MELKRFKVFLLPECDEWCDSDYLFQEFKISILKNMNIIKKIYNTNLSSLTDEEFFTLINDFYNCQVSIDNNEILLILSKMHGKEYKGFETLASNMVHEKMTEKGIKSSFDYWFEKFQCYYHVAFSSDIKIDKNKVYSKEELKKMIEEKDIHILDLEDVQINSKPNFIPEKYEELPSMNLLEIQQPNCKEFMQLLRNTVTQKKILMDLQQMIKEFESELNSVFICLDSSFRNYCLEHDYDISTSKEVFCREVSQRCKNWFESSEGINEYSEIQKRLTK